MLMQITLDLTDKQMRRVKYFLGKRYGEKKGTSHLIREAIWEIIQLEAIELLLDGNSPDELAKEEKEKAI